MSNQLLSSYSDFLNGRSWGDALTEEEADNTVLTSSNTNASEGVLEQKLNELNNLSNKWKNEEGVANLRKFLEVEGKSIVVATMEEPKLMLDYNHPAVMKYINADHLCSSLWKEQTVLRESEKNMTSDESKVQVLEEIIKKLNEWVVASNCRFSAMREIKSIGSFDFEQCFKMFYPEEENRNHCADMEATYQSITKWGISKLKKKLAKLSH
jgi:hypothetical protein